MEWGGIFGNIFEGSVDHIIYRDYTVLQGLYGESVLFNLL